MDRIIIICIFGVLAFMLASKVLKGGLGFLRIITMAMLFCLLVVLVSRPSDSPGLLPSLAKRLLSENSVPIAAEASGEVLTDDGFASGISPSSESSASRSFSTQATLPSSTISRSAEAAFSGSTTTASSNQIEPISPEVTFSTQSTTQTPSTSAPASAASEVPPPSSTRYTPPASASRPINALW